MLIGDASDVINGIFAVWFGVSVAVLVVGNFVFYLHLLGLGVKVRALWAGNPRYLADQYVRWCADHGRRPGQWPRVWRWLLISTALSMLFWVVAQSLVG